MDALTELSENPEQNYFKAQVPSIMTEYFSSLNMGQLGTFAVQSDKWRLFYALFELMTPELLKLPLEPTEPSNPIYRRAPKAEVVDHSFVPGDFDDYHDRDVNLGKGPEVKAIETKDPEVNDDPEVKEPEVKDDEVKDVVVKDPTKIEFKDVEDEGEDIDEVPVVLDLKDEEKKNIQGYKEDNIKTRKEEYGEKSEDEEDEPEVKIIDTNDKENEDGNKKGVVYVDDEMLKECEDNKKKAVIAAMKAPKFLELEPSTIIFEEFIRVIYSVVVVN